MQDTARPADAPAPAAPSSTPPAADERPALFSVGVLLIGGKALLWLFLLCLGWLALAIGIAIGMSQADGDDELLALGLGGAIGTLVIAAFGLFQLVVLLLAVKAWNGRRPWVYVLMALAVLNVASGNPIGIAVGVVALIGCVQIIDRARPAEPAAPARPAPR
jgi:hypothetical protein